MSLDCNVINFYKCHFKAVVKNKSSRLLLGSKFDTRSFFLRTVHIFFLTFSSPFLHSQKYLWVAAFTALLFPPGFHHSLPLYVQSNPIITVPALCAPVYNERKWAFAHMIHEIYVPFLTSQRIFNNNFACDHRQFAHTLHATSYQLIQNTSISGNHFLPRHGLVSIVPTIRNY